MNIPSPVESTNSGKGHSSLITYLRERNTLLLSAKTALVFGTLLAVINYGEALLSRQFALERFLPLLASYLLLFGVCMYGQIQGKRQRDHVLTEASSPAVQQETDQKPQSTAKVEKVHGRE